MGKGRFRVALFAAAAVAILLPHPGTATAMPLDVSQGSPGPLVPCSDPRGCPDLLVDPDTMEPSAHFKEFKPQDCQVQEGTTQAGRRRLLRFTYTTPNLGDGDLIVGRPEDHPEWFEFGECHGHFHFREYADYRLWTPAQFQTYKAAREANPDALVSEILAQNPGLQPILGEKRGFCVIDIWPYVQKPGAPKYLLCDFQGISVGWADEYYSDLDSQFIDITGVPSGTYVLEAEVNAEHFFEESNYRNNWTHVTVSI